MYFTSTSLTVSTENGVKTYPLEIKNNEDEKTELLQKMDVLILQYLDDKYGTNSNELRTDIEQYLANIKHSKKY